MLFKNESPALGIAAESPQGECAQAAAHLDRGLAAKSPTPHVMLNYEYKASRGVTPKSYRSQNQVKTNTPYGLCALYVNDNGNKNLYYVYTDHLGSINTLVDDNNNTIKQNFDPWGRQRNPNTWNFTGVPTPPVWLTRGYTGHENLPQFALINMNGRMYDPLLARMLSPDNEVVDPANTQMYNRYSYAFNNPLKFIDPTGNNGAGFITGGNVSLSPGSSDFSAVLGGMKNGGGFHHGKTEFRNPREKREALDEDGQYTRVTTRTKEYAGTSYGKGKEYVMSETSRMEYSFNGQSAATYTGMPGGGTNSNGWDRFYAVAKPTLTGLENLNPVSNLWDALNIAFFGTDKYGNEKGASDFGYAAIGSVPFISYERQLALEGSRLLPTVTKSGSIIAGASKAAFKAANNVGSIFIKNKHLNLGAGNFAKFATTDINTARSWVQQALRSPNAQFLPNPQIPNTFQIITNLGAAIGTKGQTSIRAVVGFDGKVINAFPVR